MTAFSRVSSGPINWEIKSVNHRFLDLSFRIPENIKTIEKKLISKLQSNFSRGKFECSLKIDENTYLPKLTLNKALLRKINELKNEVKTETGIENSGDILSVLRWPDMIEFERDSQNLQNEAVDSFTNAIEEIKGMREIEGREISKILKTKLSEIEGLTKQIRKEVPKIQDAMEMKLRSKLEELKIQVDPGRYEQELVFLIQKMDIQEEIDRLEAHTKEVARNIDLSEPVGRKLDFLMQELNREANTISSKSHALFTSSSAVDLKVLIEQMREQIQNIE
ncbi:MAG: YicC/YloC family endoribonuclease [Pseudomonadota bacterium]|nr:YicC/YloC family endoribonuclease [Pseudomonadota bacterium]